MLPQTLAGSYGKYKRETNTIADWLAVTARVRGYTSSVVTHVSSSESNSVKGPGSSGRLKGKARKAAKEAQKAAEASPIPQKCILPVDEYIRLAKFLVTVKATVPRSIYNMLDRVIDARLKFPEQMVKHGIGASRTAESDYSHEHFIKVLKSVREILQPCLQTPITSKTPSHAQSTIGPMNQFEPLQVSEPSQEFLDAPDVDVKIPQRPDNIKYEAEQFPPEKEVFLAYVMLVEDLVRLRQTIGALWLKYLDYEVDYTSLAITTNSAVDIARNMMGEVEPLCANHPSGLLGVGRRVYAAYCLAKGFSSNEIYTTNMDTGHRTYGLADRFFMSTAMILLDWSSDWDPANENYDMMKYRTLGTYDSKKDRKTMTNQERYEEDRILLYEMLHDQLAIFLRSVRSPVLDEFCRGTHEVLRGKPVSLWHVFAAQLFLDINHSMRKRVAEPFYWGQREISLLKRNIKDQIHFNESLSDIVEEHLKYTQSCIALFEIDETYRTENYIHNRANEPPSRSIAKYRWLKRSPVLVGLLLYHLRIRVHEIGLWVINSMRSLVFSAHLYNALQKEGLLEGQWRDMDLAMSILRTSDLFVGHRPGKPQDYMKQLFIQVGASVAAFKGARNRRAVSRGPPRKIKSGIPVSLMFKQRYGTRMEQINWTAEFIHDVICRSEFSLVWEANENGVMVPIHCRHNAKTAELNRKERDSERAQPDIDALKPTDLIGRLMMALTAEAPLLTYPWLLMHQKAWELLLEVQEACVPLLYELQILPSPDFDRDKEVKTLALETLRLYAVSNDRRLLDTAANVVNAWIKSKKSSIVDTMSKTIGMDLKGCLSDE